MKIYKLDIDTSKPIRKVVQMQQNSTGALSVDVSNDGKYIRNLSCALYDGDVELSAYATTDVGAGYKIDVGADTKVVKFTAKSIPIECSAQYTLVPGTARPRQMFFARAQLSTGLYRQYEFLPLVQFGDNQGFTTFMTTTAQTKDNVNFGSIAITRWNTDHPIWFRDKQNNILPDDTLISVDGYVEIGEIRTVKSQGMQLSSYTYPAVGYWTDYSLDTVIRPSENAHCYAEQEVTDPEPEPDPEPTPGE